MAWLEIYSKGMLRVNAVQLALNEEGNDRTAFYSLDTPDTYEIKPSADNTAIEARATVILAEWQTEYDAKAYARSRAVEYPTIVDQLDDIYHNGIDAWKATIKVTKDKYPKP
jgi:hypothetical protein